MSARVNSLEARAILEHLSSNAANVLQRTASLENPLYLVGGNVRDAFLSLRTSEEIPAARDLDLVTEGSAQALGKKLQAVFGGSLTCHDAFMTCTLSLPALEIDIAAAREESYPFPGSLPEVRRSTLEKDLLRRDFTLNALAVRVSPPALIDLFGGLEDLKRKQLRTLHPNSFTDDPTRILRGARLAGRLGFTFHPGTAEELTSTLAAGAARTVSPSRLKNELLLTLAEPQVAPALGVMARYGVLAQMFGFQLHAVHLEQLERLDERRRVEGVPDESYLLLLLTSVREDKLGAHADTFGWSKRRLAKRRLLLAEQDTLDERALDPSVNAALRARRPELRESLERLEILAERPKLSGKDVLELGLPEGPAVGKVLLEVARARTDGRLDSLQAERDFAQTLVEQRLSALKGDANADADTNQETA